MATPMFAMLIGVWKMVLILAVLAVMVALVVGGVILVVWLARKGKTNTPPSARQPSLPNCPRCGSPLPPDAPQGLCPRCVMAAALETQTETGGAQGPHGTKAAKPPPPAPAEIAKLFPQLEIIECLGRGGMGAVYKARQPKLDRFVALKILAPERQADTKFRERFEREARTLARLSHPNIVMVYDFGEADGYCYLLMEYVDGLTLRQVMQGRKFADGEALGIVPKICEALEFAHGRGVVHRDIKPENILLNRAGQVKIADFGIAKILEPGAQDFSLTGAKDVVGTPHYMAPEQVERPMQVDHRADIFSLGVVFYEMLTGELPLGKFQPPSRKVQVDVRLDEVVLHALEKEPDRRYQHAGEVRTDVETIVSTPASSPQATARAEESRTEKPQRASLARWINSRRSGVAVVVITALAAVFVLGWLCLPINILVQGLVSDAGTSLPLSNVEVRLLPRYVPAGQPDEPEARGDVDGRFALHVGWFTRSMAVEISAPGYTTLTNRLAPRAWGERTLIRNYQLQPTVVPDVMPVLVPVDRIVVPPVVIKTIPESGATDVDPAVTELRVTFSKPMQDGGWSWTTEGEENFPETTGQSHFESDRRTCVMPVKLKPGRLYAIWLNSEYRQNFKGTDGSPAVPYLLIFQTKQR